MSADLETARLETARLTLTPFAPEDAEALLTVFRNADVRRYLLDDAVVSPGWVADEIAASGRRFAEGKLGLWSLRLQGTQPVIGFAGFLPVRGVSQLMYGLLPEYWHQGYATEAAEAAIAAARAAGRSEIVAATDVPNTASQQVLQRLGFIEKARSAGLVAYEKPL